MIGLGPSQLVSTTGTNAGTDARQTRHLPSGVTRQGETWHHHRL